MAERRNDSSAATASRDDAKYLRSFHDEAKWWLVADRIDALVDENERLRAAVEGLLDVGERTRSGDPTLDPEEWFAIRDYARKVLREGG